MADLGRTLHMGHEASRFRWHRLHGLSAKNQNPGGAPLENWRSGARQAMEQIISKIIGFLVAACTATTVALMVGDISHYDLGFSSLDIRKSALIGAAIVALLLATEYSKRTRENTNDPSPSSECSFSLHVLRGCDCRARDG
jgi:hypothetical protein